MISDGFRQILGCPFDNTRLLSLGIAHEFGKHRLSGRLVRTQRKLVRKTIEVAIDQRQASVRKVCRQVLEDATAGREATAPSRVR